jgi:hypothetical protein
MRLYVRFWHPSRAYGNSDHSKAATVMPIKAVAPQPAQASDGRARNRPMAARFVTINIIIAMMGAAVAGGDLYAILAAMAL